MSARDALRAVREDVAQANDLDLHPLVWREANRKTRVVHAPAMLRALEAVEKLVHFDECHHTVVDKDGYEGPCDRTAFALRVDPDGGPYPVCLEHAKDGPLLALGQIRDLIETALEGR